MKERIGGRGTRGGVTAWYESRGSILRRYRECKELEGAKGLLMEVGGWKGVLFWALFSVGGKYYYSLYGKLV